MNGWTAVAAGASGGLIALAGGWTERRWQARREREREQEAASAALIGAAMILQANLATWTAGRKLRAAPFRPTIPALLELLGSGVGAIGMAHTRLSLVAPAEVVTKANAVMQVCERLPPLVNEHPDSDAWLASTRALAETTLALKNAVRRSARLRAVEAPGGNLA